MYEFTQLDGQSRIKVNDISGGALFRSSIAT